jgi:hypothetical protein
LAITFSFQNISHVSLNSQIHDFFNISIILTGTIFIQDAVHYYKKHKNDQKERFIFLFCSLLILLFDMAPFKWGLGPYRIYKLPEAPPSEIVLAQGEKGLLLELPIEDHEKEAELDPFVRIRFKVHLTPVLSWIATSIPSRYAKANKNLAHLSISCPAQFHRSLHSLGVR